jgi:tetratricopeptide (TPR) repeat protein
MGDSVYVAATLYRVRGRGAPVELHRHHVSVARDLRDVGDKFAVLADSLLVGSGATRLGTAGAVGTRSLPAWEAYDRGHRALAVWDLAAARREFRTAAELDPDYAQAQYWLAQTSTWSDEPADSVRPAAARAAALASRLAPRDASLARALSALADGRYVQACQAYNALVRADSTDFTAWYGLGECLSRDTLVVRVPRSPTSYAFRGSYRAALDAYRRALELVPAVQLAFRGAAFGRLERVLLTRPSVFREGTLEDGQRYAAYPSLDHDTLAFAAQPRAAVERSGLPASAPAALQRNRERLREIAQQWVSALPRSAAAHEALARAYEGTGQLSTSAGPSALSAVRDARRLATSAPERLRLGALEVQLALKLGDFERAGALADSLLRAPADDAESARYVAALAGLTGRATLAATAYRRAPNTSAFVAPGRGRVTPPEVLAEPARALLMYSAVGAPSDSILSLVRQIDAGVESWGVAEERIALRQALLAIPLRNAFPTTGLGPVAAPGDGTNLTRRMQRALALHDIGTARRLLSERRAMRRGRMRPTDDAMDGVFLEASALVAMGDSAGAARDLDQVLGALTALTAPLVDEPMLTPMLPRAMALRAELGAAAHDTVTAARWARAVVSLWSHADAALAPVVARQRALSRGRTLP